MELTLKFQELLEINRTLKAIIDDDKSKINVVLKFRLLGILRAAEPAVSNFEIVRNEKIMEYGTETEEGNFHIPPEDTDAISRFRSDMEQVLESEVTIHVELLKPKEIFDKGLKSEYIMGLYPLIRE